MLLHVYARELHNSIVIPPEDGGLKDERYEESNIIISASTLRNILPSRQKNMPGTR